MSSIKRCPWPGNDELMCAYHDQEWGVPLHDDQKLFEFLILDAAQAGLNWRIILHKRENFRRALDQFNPEKIAHYGEEKIAALLQDASIIRNKLKIQSFITNARAFLKIKSEFPSFDSYIWQFVDGVPIQHSCRSLADLPVRSPESDAMSKDLRQRGFSFVGSTICYAFMQAAGMVNDHLIDCFRYEEIKKLGNFAKS